MQLKELDLAVLRVDVPKLGLVAGDIGSVVQVYPEGYELEFVRADGQTVGLATLSAEDVAPVTGQDILHVRKLAIA